MAKPASASAVSTVLSPAIGLVIAIVGATVSSVKEKAVSLVLPATSVARTMTLLRPATALKLPVKVVPPSML